MRIIADELRLTERDICTNIEIYQDELAEYLMAKYGSSFRLNERLRLLSSEEAAEFWKYPGRGLALNDRVPVKVRGREITHVDYGPLEAAGKEGYKGTLYVIDECHNFFGARQWQTTGEDAVYAVSQHRKLNWDIVLVSQHTEMVEKQFRNLAQDFTVMRNLSKEKVGIFRGLNWFMKSTYLSSPTNPNAKCSETGMFKLDVEGLAKCYNTLSGVGIVGRTGGDTAERKRGFSLWWGLGAIAGCGLLLVGGSNLLGSITSKAILGKPVIAKTVSNSIPLAQQVSVNTYHPSNAALPQLVLQPTTRSVVQDTNKVWATGKIQVFGVWTVFLSDGRIFKQYRDPEFVALNDQFAEIEGVRYQFKPLKSGESGPAQWQGGSPSVVIVDGPRGKSNIGQMDQ
jgi:hypothetical protein